MAAALRRLVFPRNLKVRKFRRDHALGRGRLLHLADIGYPRGFQRAGGRKSSPPPLSALFPGSSVFRAFYPAPGSALSAAPKRKPPLFLFDPFPGFLSNFSQNIHTPLLSAVFHSARLSRMNSTSFRKAAPLSISPSAMRTPFSMSSVFPAI